MMHKRQKVHLVISSSSLNNDINRKKKQKKETATKRKQWVLFFFFLILRNRFEWQSDCQKELRRTTNWLHKIRSAICFFFFLYFYSVWNHKILNRERMHKRLWIYKRIVFNSYLLKYKLWVSEKQKTSGGGLQQFFLRMISVSLRCCHSFRFFWSAARQIHMYV